MDTQTEIPEPEQAAAAAIPDCQSERLWTALSARWLGRCRDSETTEPETP